MHVLYVHFIKVRTVSRVKLQTQLLYLVSENACVYLGDEVTAAVLHRQGSKHLHSEGLQ